MTKVTHRTEQLIAVLFPADEQEIVISELESECSKVPGCRDWSSIQLERIWFAVLKLSDGKLNRLESSVELANTDYRDLLMAADFGYDLESYSHWAHKLLKDQ